jgi:hypothetical protein
VVWEDAARLDILCLETSTGTKVALVALFGAGGRNPLREKHLWACNMRRHRDCIVESGLNAVFGHFEFRKKALVL